MYWYSEFIYVRRDDGFLFSMYLYDELDGDVVDIRVAVTRVLVAVVDVYVYVYGYIGVVEITDKIVGVFLTPLNS